MVHRTRLWTSHYRGLPIHFPPRREIWQSTVIATVMQLGRVPPQEGKGPDKEGFCWDPYLPLSGPYSLHQSSENSGLPYFPPSAGNTFSICYAFLYGMWLVKPVERY